MKFLTWLSSFPYWLGLGHLEISVELSLDRDSNMILLLLSSADTISTTSSVMIFRFCVRFWLLLDQNPGWVPLETDCPEFYFTNCLKRVASLLQPIVKLQYWSNSSQQPFNMLKYSMTDLSSCFVDHFLTFKS